MDALTPEQIIGAASVGILDTNEARELLLHVPAAKMAKAAKAVGILKNSLRPTYPVSPWMQQSAARAVRHEKAMRRAIEVLES